MRIDEMPAGREMDALVAEKVMGWRAHFRNTAWWVPSELENEFIPDPSSRNIKGWTCGNNRFAPSTDIAAAWEVWDYLKNKYHELILSWCDDMYYLLACDSKGHYLFSSEADTVPLAISRIALKAMGVTEI